MKKHRIAYLAVALAGAALDVGLKSLVFSAYGYGARWTVIEGVYSIECVTNPGGPFGILPSSLWTVISLAALPAIAAGYFRMKSPRFLETAALGLITAGAAGNAWDRATLGAVRDFIRWNSIPNFNGADAMLTVGVIVLALVWIFDDRRPVRHARPAEAPQPADGGVGDLRGADGPGA